jgi:hypothetical protein
MPSRALIIALACGLLPTGTIFLGLWDGLDFTLSRVILWAAVAGGLAAIVLAVVAARRQRAGLGLAILAGVLGLAGAAWNAFLSLFVGMGAPHGRPFRPRGRAVVAPARTGGGWIEALPAVEALDAAAREERAARFARDGLAEHASVAAFARLTLDLLAAGAPAELVEAATAAQRDEIEHARICFALASAYAGRPLGPGPLDTAAAGPPADRRRLAIESLRDGCWLEQASADALRAAARDERDPVVAAALARMAADEDRHAELAWDIVEHCLRAEPALRAPLLEEVAGLEAAGATRPAARARALLGG